MTEREAAERAISQMLYNLTCALRVSCIGYDDLMWCGFIFAEKWRRHPV